MLEGAGDLRRVPAKFENPVELNLFNKMYKVHSNTLYFEHIHTFCKDLMVY